MFTCMSLLKLKFQEAVRSSFHLKIVSDIAEGYLENLPSVFIVIEIFLQGKFVLKDYVQKLNKLQTFKIVYDTNDNSSFKVILLVQLFSSLLLNHVILRRQSFSRVFWKKNFEYHHLRISGYLERLILFTKPRVFTLTFCCINISISESRVQKKKTSLHLYRRLSLF